MRVILDVKEFKVLCRFADLSSAGIIAVAGFTAARAATSGLLMAPNEM